MNMKKILACALLGLTSVTLVACGGDDEVKDPSTGDTSQTDGVKVTFTFPENNTYKLYDTVNVKTGVTAMGDNGNRYTSYTVTCDTEGALNGDILNTDKAGTYELTYTFTNKDAVSTAKRNVTVEANGTIGANLLNVAYQSNYTSLDAWGMYNDPTNFTTKDGNIIVDATTQKQDYEIRLDTNANQFTLVEGQTYQILVKAKSSQNRNIKLQVGNMFSGDPYWAGAADAMTIGLTTEMSTKAAYFTATSSMGADLSKLCLTLEMGTVGTFVSSTVEIESISLHTFEGNFDDETAPTITQNQFVAFKDDANLSKDDILKLFTFNDNVTSVGELTLSVDRLLDPSKDAADSINTNTLGDWTATISATDEAGNKVTGTFTITVAEKVTGLNNYFTANSKLTTWTSGTNGYINVDDDTLSNIELSYAVYYEWYDPQFFIDTEYFGEAGTYTVSMVVKGDTARPITIGGTVSGTEISANVVNLVKNVEQEVTFDITIKAGDKYQMQVLFDMYTDGGVATTPTDLPDGQFETLTIKNLTVAKKA